MGFHLSQHLISLLLLTCAPSALACRTTNASHSTNLLSGNDYCPAANVICNDGTDMYLSVTSVPSISKNESARTDPSSTMLHEQDFGAPPSPLYTITPIPSKGLGLIALLPIPRGTVIILESPLLTVPMPSLSPGKGYPLATMLSSLTSSYSTLSHQSKTLFLSLHNHRFPGDETSTPPQSDLLTIFRSNAYNTGESDVGLFPLIARINHDCRPNSVNYWSEGMGKRVIYAGKDIGVGEEITVTYIPLLKPVKDRRGRLAQYGFTCACEACREEDEGVTGSGKRRGKIADLMDVLEQKVQVRSEKKLVNERLVKRMERLLGLLREEGLVEVEYWVKAFRFGAVFSERAGDLKGARRLVERELEELRLAEEDSSEIEAALERLGRLKR
ncbi:hypothetical protein VTL71DRAFT_12351 [Oculimacula yallundae]|uniref:SET domain-containing protein n=1 Tax=Oculimacula yallundae TaxID=86028 RepID=A0ABR4CPH3_9HELO